MNDAEHMDFLRRLSVAEKMDRTSPETETLIEALQLASIEYPNPHDELVVISVAMRDRLVAALSAGHAQTPDLWRPAETAPKDGSAVDLWCRNISYGSTGEVRAPDMWWDEDVDRWVDRDGSILEPKWRPTHWMKQLPGPQGPDTSTDRTPPKPERSPWPAKGDLMTFLGKNGYPQELTEALRIFKVGQQYRVFDCNVQNWSHSVRFEDVVGWYNGVMFERVSVSSIVRGDK